MDVSGLISPEGAVFWPGDLGLQISQVADAMTAQAAVQPRARGIRVQELTDDSQKIVERDQQRLAQRYGEALLGWRQRRLQPMGRMAAILDAIALAPLVDGLRCHPETLGKNRPCIIAVLNRRSDLRRRRRLLVKMDQHGRPPSRSSLRTDLAMKRADRRGEM